MAIIKAAVGPMISRSGPHMHYALSYSHDWKEVISFKGQGHNDPIF